MQRQERLRYTVPHEHSTMMGFLLCAVFGHLSPTYNPLTGYTCPRCGTSLNQSPVTLSRSRCEQGTREDTTTGEREDE